METWELKFPTKKQFCAFVSNAMNPMDSSMEVNFHQRITDLINLMFPYWIIINRINNKRKLDFIFNLTTAFVFFLSLSLSPSSTYQE